MSEHPTRHQPDPESAAARRNASPSRGTPPTRDDTLRQGSQPQRDGSRPRPAPAKDRPLQMGEGQQGPGQPTRASGQLGPSVEKDRTD